MYRVCSYRSVEVLPYTRSLVSSHPSLFFKLSRSTRDIAWLMIEVKQRISFRGRSVHLYFNSANRGKGLCSEFGPPESAAAVPRPGGHAPKSHPHQFLYEVVYSTCLSLFRSPLRVCSLFSLSTVSIIPIPDTSYPALLPPPLHSSPKLFSRTISNPYNIERAPPN
jgi:hypothetical protein